MKPLFFLLSIIFPFFFFSCEKDNYKDPDPIEVEEEPSKFSWKDKHILWLGTSIPEGGGEKSYPIYIGKRLSATIHNEAVGGSAIRASLHHKSWMDMEWYAVSRSLSHTIEEKELFIKYFKSGLDENANITPGGKYGWRDFCPRCPEEISDKERAKILSCSYENKIVNKYLNSDHPDFIVLPDVIVIDHGYNDLAHGKYDNYSRKDAIAVPIDPLDRSRYIGAVNFIIDIIKQYSPGQKIILIGHYENQNVPAVSLAQLNLFDYWEGVYPGFKLWEELGWTQDIDPETGLTYLQTNLPDNLHPHTDTRIDPETGYKLAIKQIGDACVEFFKDLYDLE